MHENAMCNSINEHNKPHCLICSFDILKGSDLLAFRFPHESAKVGK